MPSFIDCSANCLPTTREVSQFGLILSDSLLFKLTDDVATNVIPCVSSIICAYICLLDLNTHRRGLLEVP